MPSDTMNAFERLEAAVNLEPSDRVPVYPHINAEFPLKLAGRPTSDAYNVGKGGDLNGLMLDLQTRTGFDGTTLPVGGLAFSDEFIKLFAFFYGDTMRYPGADERVDKEGSPPQFAEREIITPGDYDAIIALGWNNWCGENMDRISKTLFGLPLDQYPLPQIAEMSTLGYVHCRDEFARRGIPIIAGTNPADPQMLLSLLRTLTGFSMDLYRCPDKVTGVLKTMCRDLTQGAIDSMLRAGPPSSSGLPGIMVAAERGSGAIFNLKVFEKFVWPYMRESIHAWVDAGFVVTMHLDTNWTKNFPYFLELPRKKCIVMLDSTSDIFKAKEVLGNHLCIMGDVPPALSALGTPEEMDAYCRKLIEVVGRGGGFILSTGCAVPAETKLENFQAMIDSTRRHSAN